jgi:hypothetical protein
MRPSKKGNQKQIDAAAQNIGSQRVFILPEVAKMSPAFP